MLKLSKNDMEVELEKNKFDDEIGDMIGAVEIFKDNTQKLITSEHQIKLAMQEATTANKAKSIFLARMSHELRTPLNAILGFTNILKKSMNTSNQEKENLNIIKRSADHLLSIINEILELSKIEAGKMELSPKEFNFYELIKDIENLFATRYETKGLDFSIQISKNLPKYIKADVQRLRQILINLLGNSLKFTKKGEIKLVIYETHNKIFFELKDSGIGISKENLEKVFKPFVQVKQDSYTEQGTGLGLAITKELITLMGGNIYVKSEVNVGTQFYFSINYEKVEEKNFVQKNEEKEIIGVKNENFTKTILVVDDIKENRDLIVLLLNSYGFKTLQANSGLEALKLYDEEKIDLIFMDILMENLDGLETTKQIRSKENGKNIPIIALSANVYDEDKKEALKSGANDFLPKPVEEKDILLILEKYLKIELEYENEKNEDKIDMKNEIKNLPKEFFEKLREMVLNMDNDGILHLLDEYRVTVGLRNYINILLEEFKYQELIKFLENIVIEFPKNKELK